MEIGCPNYFNISVEPNRKGFHKRSSKGHSDPSRLFLWFLKKFNPFCFQPLISLVAIIRFHNNKHNLLPGTILISILFYLLKIACDSGLSFIISPSILSSRLTILLRVGLTKSISSIKPSTFVLSHALHCEEHLVLRQMSEFLIINLHLRVILLLYYRPSILPPIINDNIFRIQVIIPFLKRTYKCQKKIN